MIRAETAFNIFTALSEEEKKRFFQMCGVSPIVHSKKGKKPVLTDEEATEYLLHKIMGKGNSNG